MVSHLLKAAPGTCQACAAAYSDVAYPGPFFASIRAWSLSPYRCTPASVAIGTIDAPDLVPIADPRNLYAAPGKPEGIWPNGAPT